MKILGVILARKGSKRLPDKNTKLLNGKPLIEYTIDAALESGVIDTLVVSTDDNLIKNIIISQPKYKNVYIIDRPKYLATDNAPSEECILHVMDHYAPHDYVMLLQPTSPLRTAVDIKCSVKYMKDFCQWGVLTYNERTKKPNGNIYITRWDYLYNNRKLVRDEFYYQSEKDSIDIDTELDFKIAEMLLKERENV